MSSDPVRINAPTLHLASRIQIDARLLNLYIVCQDYSTSLFSQAIDPSSFASQKIAGDRYREYQEYAEDDSAEIRHLSQIVDALQAIVDEESNDIDEVGVIIPSERREAETIELEFSNEYDRAIRLAKFVLLELEGRRDERTRHAISGTGQLSSASALNSNAKTVDSIDLQEALRRALHHLIGTLSSRLRIRRDFESKLEERFRNFVYGLTHEINNPLANIAGRAEMLLSNATDASQRKSLKTIHDSAIRAHEMLAEMMLAIQCPEISLKPTDLRVALENWCNAQKEWLASRGLRWETEIDDHSLWTQADLVALTEALRAALRNSVDACRQGDTIRLVAHRVEEPTGNREPRSRAAASPFSSARGTKIPATNAKSDLRVRIAIIDNGRGLSREALQKAWDIYYCGREAGRGLGIGLSKIRRIVQNHLGDVWLDSLPNHGCALEIRLPWHHRRAT